MTTWYFNYQMEAESNWFPALAESRDQIVRDRRPPFTTILDVDKNLKRDSLPEEQAEARYRGPLYFDLDSNDVEEVIEQYQKLLRKLRDNYEIELNQLGLWATGGRGFHILIPQAIFMSKPNPRGYPFLPDMYKEVANAVYVDTLDLNIYSAKRGRMFRTENVERTNKRFKVPITVEESFNMDEDLYIKITSSPRHVAAPAAPVFSDRLALVFATANDKVSEAVKSRKDTKVDTKLLESFGNKIPPTLGAVMRGEHLAEGVGFQKIATQLAITANALNMSLETFIESCQDLIKNHVGDGERYGTPSKRHRELIRMYQYMAGNPCYSFSVGGIKSLMVKGYRAVDLDYGEAGVSEEASDDEMQFSVSQGINVTEQGIFKKVDGAIVRVSALGLANPKQLLDLFTGEVHGYEVDVFIEGRKVKTKIISMDAFTSRNSFLKFTLSAGSCNIGLTDAQIGALADIMRVRTEKNGKQVYTVRREGLDVIHTPDGKLDVVWADQFGVASNLGINYRLTGSMTEDIQFRTDLRMAPALIDSPENREFFDRLFKINKIETVGRIFGFYMSTFLSQPIRYLFGKYPYLQVFGQAGSGKSETNELLANLHYYSMEPVVSSALSSTKFTVEEFATCSGSMPFILDEFKPREMRKDMYENVKGILRSNYNGQAIGKGAVSNTTGQGKLTLTKVSNKSPMVVISEAQETQTALLERCVLVPVTKEGKKGRRENFEFCKERRKTLGMLGRVAIDKGRGIDLDGLRKGVNKHIDALRQMMGGRADDNDRQLYNIAVLMSGLDFGRHLLRSVFGDRYDEVFDDMTSSITRATDTLVPKVQSESAKVLDAIAHMSWGGDKDERYCIESTLDYVKYPEWIDIDLKNAYTKYARFRRSTGEEVLYDSYDAFYAAMSNYQGTMDTVTPDSPLKHVATTTVFRFNSAYMVKDGVQEFK